MRIWTRTSGHRPRQPPRSMLRPIITDLQEDHWQHANMQLVWINNRPSSLRFARIKEDEHCDATTYRFDCVYTGGDGLDCNNIRSHTDIHTCWDRVGLHNFHDATCQGVWERGLHHYRRLRASYPSFEGFGLAYSASPGDSFLCLIKV